MRKIAPLVMMLSLWAGLPGQSWAAAGDDKAVADFYRGKTVRIIVENMAGAGSIILANHMFNVAAKDGTVIGNFSGQIILEQLFAIRRCSTTWPSFASWACRSAKLIC